MEWHNGMDCFPNLGCRTGITRIRLEYLRCWKHAMARNSTNLACISTYWNEHNSCDWTDYSLRHGTGGYLTWLCRWNEFVNGTCCGRELLCFWYHSERWN